MIGVHLLQGRAQPHKSSSTDRTEPGRELRPDALDRSTNYARLLASGFWKSPFVPLFSGEARRPLLIRISGGTARVARSKLHRSVGSEHRATLVHLSSPLSTIHPGEKAKLRPLHRIGCWPVSDTCSKEPSAGVRRRRDSALVRTAGGLIASRMIASWAIATSTWNLVLSESSRGVIDALGLNTIEIVTPTDKLSSPNPLTPPKSSAFRWSAM